MSHIDTYLPHLKPQIEQLNQIINNNQSFLLIGHASPDGDCIGSLLGFGRWLENQGKQVHYVTPTGYNKKRNRILGQQNIDYTEDNPDYMDLIQADVKVFLDLSGKGLLGKNPELFIEHTCKQSVCIDHHLYPSIPVNCMISDTNSSSCGELLWEIMNEIQASAVDKQVASYCYLGMITDTGEVALSAGFVREKDSIRTFENALSMLQSGADKKHIIDHLSILSQEQIQFLSTSFQRMNHQGDIVWTWYESKELEEYMITKEDADLGFDIIRKINCPVSIRFGCYDDFIHCSLRAKGNYDVQVIATYFGGGGHKLAAGCRISRNASDLQVQLQVIVNQIQDMISAQQL